MKNELIKILGDEYNDANSSRWFYFIGKKNFLFKKYLYIHFDKFGKVCKIET
jgi:hypothetical protein